MEEIATPAAPAKSRPKYARNFYYLISSTGTQATRALQASLGLPAAGHLRDCWDVCRPYLRSGRGPENQSDRLIAAVCARILLAHPRQERTFDSAAERAGYQKALGTSNHAVLLCEAELDALLPLAELVKPYDFTTLSTLCPEAFDRAVEALKAEKYYGPFAGTVEVLHMVRELLRHPELEVAPQDVPALCALPLWKQIEPLLDTAGLQVALQQPEKMEMAFDRAGVSGRLIFTPSENTPGGWCLRYAGCDERMNAAMEQILQAHLATPRPLPENLHHALYHLGVWPADATQELIRRYVTTGFALSSLSVADLQALAGRGMGMMMLQFCGSPFTSSDHGEITELLAQHSHIVVQNSGGRTPATDVRRLLLPVICDALQVEPTPLAAVEFLAPAGGARRAILECNSDSITLRLERVEDAEALRTAIREALTKTPQDGWHLLPVPSEVSE